MVERTGGAVREADSEVLQALRALRPEITARADEIEACWRFADAIRDAWESDDPPPILSYPAGTWGPAAANALFHGCEGSWSTGEDA